MMAWKEASLGDICELYQPKTISSSELVNEGKYLVYGANGIIGRYDRYNHEESVILVTCRGATCGTVNVSEPQSWINGNAMVVKPRDKSLDFHYLKHLLRGGIDLSVTITGAAQPQITRQSLAPVRFKYPPIDEQQRIATILDKAYALRAKRREALARLDRLAQSIFVEMFGDPTENTNGFPVKKLIELVDCTRPITYGILMPGPDLEAGVPYVRVVDMKNGGIELSGIRRTAADISNAYKRSLLKKGDLLMSIRGHVGRIATVPAPLEGANITQDSARLAIVGAQPLYVRECLRSVGFQRWMARHTKGVAVRGINLSDVKLMPIPVPPKAVQMEFVECVGAIEHVQQQSAVATSQTDALFAALQNRAFSGAL